MSLLAYAPIAGGVLTGKYRLPDWPVGARFSNYRLGDERLRAMTRRYLNPRTLNSTERFAGIAERAGMSLTTLAVAWVLSHDFVGSAIIGATHPDQLKESLRGASVKLPDDVVKACDAVSRQILYPMG